MSHQGEMFKASSHDGQTSYAIQNQEEDRVRNDIGHHVLQFLRSVGVGGQFTASELYLHCLSKKPHLAPGSSCRILRVLRNGGAVKYKVVNRSQSRYQVESILN